MRIALTLLLALTLHGAALAATWSDLMAKIDPLGQQVVVKTKAPSADEQRQLTLDYGYDVADPRNKALYHSLSDDQGVGPYQVALLATGPDNCELPECANIEPATILRIAQRALVALVLGARLDNPKVDDEDANWKRTVDMTTLLIQVASVLIAAAGVIVTYLIATRKHHEAAKASAEPPASAPLAAPADPAPPAPVRAAKAK